MEVLRNRFEKAIVDSDLHPMIVATQNSERLAVECEKIAIQAQVDLLKKLKKVIVKKGHSTPEIDFQISELESQLKG